MSLNKISSGNMQRSASDGGGVNKKKSKDLISVRSDSITGVVELTHRTHPLHLIP